MVQTDELLKQNNELLRQLLAEVRKVAGLMETMNEMTRKRLPYKWIVGEQETEKDDD